MFLPRRRLCLVLAATIPHIAYSQGPLQPPGPPAPAMKSLDQLHSALADINDTQEKRIPITSLPVNITRPGSYYFIGSVNFAATSGNAITVTVSNVTIDLNGFTLSSSPGVTGDAIRINSGLRNVAVKNGAIAGDSTVTVSGLHPNRSWSVTAAGFNNGINSPGSQTRNIRISDVSVSGCRGDGIVAADGTIIERATASENAGDGIRAGTATVTNCSASLNFGDGILATAGAVINCTAKDNGDNGIAAHTVVNCSAYGNQNNGLAGNAVSNSSAEANEQDGIVVGDGTVTNSNASNNVRDGISAANGVVAFCRAKSNGQQNIDAAGATLTGNNANP